jgi:hypothetical protein
VHAESLSKPDDGLWASLMMAFGQGARRAHR